MPSYSPLSSSPSPSRARIARWLIDLRRVPVPVHSATFARLRRQTLQFTRPSAPPAHANIRLRLYRPRKRWPSRVLFWASDAVPGNATDVASRTRLRGAEHAYGEYRNMGVAESSPDGRTLVLELRCPTPYLMPRTHAWSRHVHFVDVRNAQYGTVDIATVRVLPGRYDDPQTGARCSCAPLCEPRCAPLSAPLAIPFSSMYVRQARRLRPAGSVGLDVTDAATDVDADALHEHVLAKARDVAAGVPGAPVAPFMPVVVYGDGPTAAVVQALVSKGHVNIFLEAPTAAKTQ